MWPLWGTDMVLETFSVKDTNPRSLSKVSKQDATDTKYSTVYTVHTVAVFYIYKTAVHITV